MAVAELPLPPFPCIGNKNKPPAMQVCSQTALASSKKPPCYNEYKVRQPNHYNKEESKWTNKKKKLKKYSEHLTKHLRLRQRIVFKIKHSKTIRSLGKFPKNQLTPNGLPAHQIKQNTKDKLSQAKAGISPLHAKPQ